MIGLGIHGWTRVVSKAKVHLVAPEAPDAGVITIRERSSLRTLRDLLFGSRDPGGAAWIVPPTPLTNAEGEHGVTASIRARIDGLEAQRDVVMFVGDGFLLTIIAVTRDVWFFERTSRLVRALATRSFLGLGARRRLVLYPAPRGWRGVPRGLDTQWFPAEFPRVRARLTVFPAVPAQGIVSGDLADALANDHPQIVWARSERTTPRGLEFEIRTGPAIRIAVANDTRFIYAARIEHERDDEIAAFDATIDGMQPIPMLAVDSRAVAHWVE